MKLDPSIDLKSGRVAFFDVDKTITREDTFLLVLRTGLKQSPWRLAILLLVWPFFSLKRGRAKGAALWSITVGQGEGPSLAWMKKVIADRSESLWLPEAESELRRLEAEGLAIVFVTASAPHWIEPLLEARGFQGRKLIGTRIRRFAGGWCVQGENCFGKEKVTRIEEVLDRNVIWAIGYSDSAADLPMLERCQERVLVSPTQKHKAVYDRVLGAKSYRIALWRR